MAHGILLGSLKSTQERGPEGHVIASLSSYLHFSDTDIDSGHLVLFCKEQPARLSLSSNPGNWSELLMPVSHSHFGGGTRRLSWA